jgi:hypothetical protein
LSNLALSVGGEAVQRSLTQKAAAAPYPGPAVILAPDVQLIRSRTDVALWAVVGFGLEPAGGVGQVFSNKWNLTVAEIRS